MNWIFSTVCSLQIDGYEGYLPNGYNAWKTDQLEQIKQYIAEFVIQYRISNTNDKYDGADMPKTIKTYIYGIQRHFRSKWCYDICLWEGPVFQKEKRRFVYNLR